MITDSNHNTFQQFIGDGEPHITVHQGPQQWGITHTIEHFKDAQWTFYADGRFFFTPPAHVALRTDLQPMIGTYSLEDSTIEFAAEQYISQGTSSSLDGTIHLQEEQILLHAVYTLASHASLIVVIQQPLQAYGHVAVPSAFTIKLQGEVDSCPFGPLPATLKILPTVSPLDTNPFMVELAMEDRDCSGG